jgi:hypothetical protein
MTQILWGGEAVTTETQPMRDAARLAMTAPPTPHASEFVTAQTEPPAVVARDRAIPLALVVGLISLTGGGLAAVLPIDREWLPAIGFVFAAINAGAAYYLRAVGEGEKDSARAERV